jgi:hypothetical protein
MEKAKNSILFYFNPPSYTSAKTCRSIETSAIFAEV